MFTCPQCKVRLVKAKGPMGVFWVCPQCNGRSASVSQLRNGVPRETVNAFWQAAREGGYKRQRPCPCCRGKMEEVPAPTNAGAMNIDVCIRCHFVWFDPSEYEALSVNEGKETNWVRTLPVEAREKVALLEIEEMRTEAERPEYGVKGADHWWQYILGFLGMPVEHQSSRVERFPWVTWISVLAVVASSIYAFTSPALFLKYGFIPDKAMRSGGLTLLTCFFLHGGIGHLFGNMYFLSVFGDNVEDFMGRWRYVLLLVLASAAGCICHAIGEPRSSIPLIGASGGISGVLAYYAFRFPRASIGLLFIVRFIRMPAFVLFLLWIGLQIWGASRQMEGYTNVSALGHLGGAAVGYFFWLFSKGKN